MQPAVRTVRNAVRILDLLGREQGLGVTRISRLLGLPKSSAHDLLSTLHAEGLVDKDADRNLYRLGLKLFELGSMARANLELRRIAAPYLKTLNQSLDETVHLTILDGYEVLYIECFESTKQLRTYSVIGVRAPLHCTAVGKAILAFLGRDKMGEIIKAMGLPRFTENTITAPEALEAEMARIRQVGFAVDDAEHELGVRCVGAPIRDHEGIVVASMSVSGPSQRMTPDRDAVIGGLAIETTRQVSRRLGYREAHP